MEMRRVLKHNLAPISEAVATATAMLFLPAAVMDVVFGTDLLDLLSPVALVILAIAAIVIVGAHASLTTGPD